MSIDDFISKKSSSWEKYEVYQKFKDKINPWIESKIRLYVEAGQGEKKISTFKASQYISYLNLFNEYLKKDNFDIMQFSSLDIQVRNKLFSNFINHLLAQGKYGRTTIFNTIQSRIKSFYTTIDKKITAKYPSQKHGSEIKFVKVDKKLNMRIHLAIKSNHYKLLHLFASQTSMRIEDILEKITNGEYCLKKYLDRYYLTRKKGEIEFSSSKRMVGIKALFITKEIEEMLISIYNIDDLSELDLSKLFVTRYGSRIFKRNFSKVLYNIRKTLDLPKNESLSANCFRKFFETEIRNWLPADEADPRYMNLITLHSNKDIDNYDKRFESIPFLYEMFLKWENAVLLFIKTHDTEITELKHALKEKDEEIQKIKHEKALEEYKR